MLYASTQGNKCREHNLSEPLLILDIVKASME